MRGPAAGPSALQHCVVPRSAGMLRRFKARWAPHSLSNRLLPLGRRLNAPPACPVDSSPACPACLPADGSSPECPAHSPLRPARFGPPPDPVPSTRSFRELLGVNGIWGWGDK